MSNLWLIGVPNKSADGRDQKIESASTKKYIDERTLNYSTNFTFKIPDLKVGTMDSLMSLSEEMSKIDQIVGSIAKKLERAFHESVKEDEKAKDGDSIPDLKVGDKNLSPLKYIEKFEWNQARYPKRGNIKQLVENLLKEAAKADEELKKHQQEYNDVRQQYSAIERKETGTMLVKPLNPYIKNRADLVETENLTTLLIVVARAKEQEFLSSYEILEDIAAERETERAKERERQQTAAAAAGEAATKPAGAPPAKAPVAMPKPAVEQKEEDPNENLNAGGPVEKKEGKKTGKPKAKQTCKNVVPRSAKLLADEAGDEYVLYRIIVFKKGADTIKNLCRERRYTVRAFAFDAEEEKDLGEKKAALQRQRKKLKNFFQVWSKTTFGEVFAAWIHLKAMRVFVEAVLRFGLPVNFLAVLIEPRKGAEKNLRASLAEAFAHLQPSGETGKDTDVSAIAGGDADLSGLTTTEFYPYVYVPIEFKD